MLGIKILSLFACSVLIYAHPSGGQDVQKTNPSSTVNHDLKLTIIPDDQSTYENIEKGSKFQLNCNFNKLGKVWWTKDGQYRTIPSRDYDASSAMLVINVTDVADGGDYICSAKTEDGHSVNRTVKLIVEDYDLMPGSEDVTVQVGSSASLTCPIADNDIDSSIFEWRKLSEPKNLLKGTTTRNGRSSTMTLTFSAVTYETNGTYECSVKNGTGTYVSRGERHLIVTGPPEVRLSIKTIGTHSIYLNWTTIEHNIPVTKYVIEYWKQGGAWMAHPEELDRRNTSLVLRDLESGVNYRFRINVFDDSKVSRDPIHSEPDGTKTLAKEAHFIPTLDVTKDSNISITIKFPEIPEKLKDYIDYFNVSVSHGVNTTKTDYLSSNGTTVVIEPLEDGAMYEISAAACNSYINQCGNWSSVQEIGNSSPGLYYSVINLIAVIITSLYFSAIN